MIAKYRRKCTYQAAMMEDSVEGRQVPVKTSTVSATFKESSRKNVYKEKAKTLP